MRKNNSNNRIINNNETVEFELKPRHALYGLLVILGLKGLFTLSSDFLYGKIDDIEIPSCRPTKISGHVLRKEFNQKTNYSRIFIDPDNPDDKNIYYIGSYSWAETWNENCEPGKAVTIEGCFKDRPKNGVVSELPVTGIKGPQNICF